MSETTPMTPQQRPPTGDVLDRLFGWLRGIGIRRDGDDRWVSGVSAGVAHRIGVDPILVRAAFVVLACFGGFGVTAYLVLWATLPTADGEILAERAVRHGEGWPIVLLVVAAFSLFGGPLFGHGDGGWWAFGWVVPVAAVAWVIYRLARKEPIVPTGMCGPSSTPASGYGAPGDSASGSPYATYAPAADPARTPEDAAYAPPGVVYNPSGAAPATGPAGPARPTPPAGPAYAHQPTPAPRPRRRGPGAGVSLLGLGLALVAFGAGYVLRDAVGFPGDPVTLGLIAALATLGLLLTVLGVMGRRGGFSTLLATVLAVVTLGAVTLPGVHVTDGVGDRTWVPAPTATDQSFRLAAGDGVLDLRNLPTDPPAPVRISVTQGLGDLTVRVPAGLTARVSSSIGVGDIQLDGRTIASRPGDRNRDSTERGSATTVVGSGPVDVYVDTSVGIGTTRIQKGS